MIGLRSMSPSFFFLLPPVAPAPSGLRKMPSKTFTAACKHRHIITMTAQLLHLHVPESVVTQRPPSDLLKTPC